MHVGFLTTDLGSGETLLVTLPESLELLGIGIVLVLVAVLIRSILSRGERGKANREAVKKA